MRVVDQNADREPRRPDAKLDDQGFIMVALLVGVAISAIWMAALLPAWSQQEQREREAELIFRGEQIARAIYLYRQKNQAPPRDLDMLVSQHFLRKKYLDPITGKDFLPVGGVTASAGPPAPGPGGGPGAVQVQAGMTGVRSTSNASSIVVYMNQQTYSQFPFDWTQEAQRSGRVVPQIPPGGAPGRPGQNPGGGPGGIARPGGGTTTPGPNNPRPQSGGPGGAGPGNGPGQVSAPGAGNGPGVNGPGVGGPGGPRR